jgi:hypothetical protein
MLSRDNPGHPEDSKMEKTELVVNVLQAANLVVLGKKNQKVQLKNCCEATKYFLIMIFSYSRSKTRGCQAETGKINLLFLQHKMLLKRKIDKKQS